MKRYFADTSYYLALLNKRDEYHERAADLTSGIKGEIVTTAWVLTEIADAFSRPGQREHAGRFILDLLQDARVSLIEPKWHVFNRGLAHYLNRPDKVGSLTDCISFIVMEENGLTEALSADHHFEQAGFVILLG